MGPIDPAAPGLYAYTRRVGQEDGPPLAESAQVQTACEVIDVEHLPAELREPDEGARISGAAMLEESGADPSAGLKDVVKVATAKLERELIQRALDQTEGNVTHAARLLKISRKSLQTKMKELGLRDE